MRFSEAGGRFSRCHIYLAGYRNLFFSVFVLGPVAEGPPERYVKKLGSKTVWMVFFAVSAFLVICRTFLRPKTRRYTFSRPLPQNKIPNAPIRVGLSTGKIGKMVLPHTQDNDNRLRVENCAARTGSNQLSIAVRAIFYDLTHG